MKKLISTLLVLVMLCTVIPFASVFAETPNGYTEEAYNTLLNAMLEYATGDIVPEIDNTDEMLEGKFIGQLIDVSEYNLSDDAASEVMQDIMDNEPMLFYMDTIYFIWQDNFGDIAAIQPVYTISNTEVKAATEFVNEKVEAINSTLPKDLDDYEKALYFYEYIALNFDYDYDYEIYDIYNMFKNGIGVCQAYTLLYDELLTRNGIKNRAAVSRELVHMWNEIKLGDQWYQVDITWGDVEKPFHSIKYDYFLMSNQRSAFLHKNATDIMVEYDCTDTTFDNIAWKRYAYQYAFANGNVYCMDTNGEYIQEVNLLNGETENAFYIGTENNEYFMSQVWETYSQVGSWNEHLIYNSGDDIMAYNPATDKLLLLYTASEGAILQMKVFNGVVTYSPKDTKNNTEIYYYVIDFESATEAKKPTIPTDPDDPYNPDDPVLLFGDVNGDEVVDMKDYGLLKRYCFGTANLSADALILANVNHDDIVDMKDYSLLKRHCFGTYVIQ